MSYHDPETAAAGSIHPKLMTHRDSPTTSARQRDEEGAAARPSYEAEPPTKEDAIVQQLSGRQWDDSHLAGPRQNFEGGAPAAQGGSHVPRIQSGPQQGQPRPSGVRRSDHAEPIRPSRRKSSSDPYAHVRSIVADYRRGSMTETQARYSIARGPHDPSRRTSSAAPPAASRTAATQAQRQPLSEEEQQQRRASLHPGQRTGGATPRSRPSSAAAGAPRCASIIPDRYKYVPKPAKTEEELEEERRQREAEAAAQRRRERIMNPMRRNGSRSKSKRASSRTASRRLKEAAAEEEAREAAEAYGGTGRETNLRVITKSAPGAVGTSTPRGTVGGDSVATPRAGSPRPNPYTLYPLRAPNAPTPEPSAEAAVVDPLLYPAVYRSKLVFDMKPPVLSA